MSHSNCSTISRKGKHITFEERVKLEALSSTDLTTTEIGERLGGRSSRTIHRELAKGKVRLLNSNLTEKICVQCGSGSKRA